MPVTRIGKIPQDQVSPAIPRTESVDLRRFLRSVGMPLAPA